MKLKESKRQPSSTASAIAYWLAPVKSSEEHPAEEVLQKLVGEEKIYAFGEKTLARKHVKPGDLICFYAATKGVVAHAKVSSFPELQRHRAIPDHEKYPWIFRLGSPRLYLDDPIILNRELRCRLEAFRGADLDRYWAWFVQGAHRISRNDFVLLTRQK